MLFITYILPVISQSDTLISAIIRDNELISTYQSWSLYNAKVRVFELKNGTTSDIFNGGKTFDFGPTNRDFVLEFLDIPEDFQGDKNKLWVRFKFQGFSYPAISPFLNWVGYLKLDDMSLINDSSLIQFPTYNNFPLRGYTINTVTNVFGSALYITGGELYSTKNKKYSECNSFYKYNFTTKEWTDMTSSIDGKLKPLSCHNSVVIDNKYLVILGGKRRVDYDEYKYYYNRPTYEFNSLYNLAIFDTFTNTSENVNINVGIFDTNTANIQFNDFLATVYKDKIIVLGGSTGKYQSDINIANGHLGILDLKSKSWAWTPILDENGTIYDTLRVDGKILTFNDQIIISSSVYNRSNYIPVSVYDMVSQRMKHTLRSPKHSNDTEPRKENGEMQDQSKILPTYAIILIAIGFTILLLGFMYLIYRKIKSRSGSKDGKSKYSGPVREIWANPDIDTNTNVITFDKINCSTTLYSNGL